MGMAVIGNMPRREDIGARGGPWGMVGMRVVAPPPPSVIVAFVPFVHLPFLEDVDATMSTSYCIPNHGTDDYCIFGHNLPSPIGGKFTVTPDVLTNIFYGYKTSLMCELVLATIK